MSKTARTSLDARQSLVIGMTLFSMFFGAGNLILPPLLGAQAGASTVPAMVGFLIAGIGLPVLGVISTAFVGSTKDLAGRVHPVFGSVFAALTCLAIGPLLAIPRTSSTSFEMIVPLLPEGASVDAARLVFSVAFFAVAILFSMRPSRISHVLGKITGPALIVLIVLVVGAVVLSPEPSAAQASAPYDTSPATQGFLTGYQTMDLLASLTFGLVITQNIRALGVTSNAGVTREIAKAGLFMGVLMALVYCGLAYVGVAEGPNMPGVTNGAAVLTGSAQAHFGIAGSVIMAVIFLLACLNVCISLTTSCSTYFAKQLPRVPYAAWVVVFAAFSCVISNFGLDAILAFSVPLLSALYPPAIVLVLMGMFAKTFDRWRWSWPLAVGLAAVVSVATSLCDVIAPDTWTVLDALPLAGVGMGWVLPAAVGLVVGIGVSKARSERTSTVH